MPLPPTAIAILDRLTVEDLKDLFTALVSAAMSMEIEQLDLHEFPRSQLIAMIWVLASAGPSFRIGDEIGRRRLPDAEALEKLARLAASTWRREVAAR